MASCRSGPPLPGADLAHRTAVGGAGLSFLVAVVLGLGRCAAAEIADPVTTPVAANGWLGTRHNAIVNEHGVATQLRGVSTHGIQWCGDFYRDGRAIHAAATAWGADVVRIAVYVTEGGYLDSASATRQSFDDLIDGIVKACVAEGIYCIIDWHVHHPGDPMLFVEEAKQFFDAMATRYATLPNVIYEIANEPNGTGWDGKKGPRDISWDEITRYADAVIPVIRHRSPRSLILVGTPDWCSFGISGGRDWRDIVDRPLPYPNIAYVVHAYAVAHGFHAEIDQIADRLPLFVTEWSAASFRNDSRNDLVRAQPWIELMMRRRISWTYWNFAPGDGVFGAFLPESIAAHSLAPTGPQVSDTGKLLYLLLATPRDEWAASATVR